MYISDLFNSIILHNTIIHITEWGKKNSFIRNINQLHFQINEKLWGESLPLILL